VLRVAIVGARRRVQGTGEFVARWFDALGCRVEAIAGTSEPTVSEALNTLRERSGIACRGYTSVESLLAAEAPDALAICSPAESHRTHLELALEAGCHVFCEKPLVWPSESTSRLVQGFAARGLALEVNAQWPWTLPAFERLHPGVLERAERFEMGLAPVSRGLSMIVDAGPHFLSLLRAIAGPGRLAETRVLEAAADRLALAASYAGTRRHLEAVLRLERRVEPPRPAHYAVNGHLAARRIDPPYQVSFEAPGLDRRVAFEDPTRLAVADFVSAARTKRLPDVEALIDLSAQLDELVAAAAGVEREPA
jgi:predicted dehydrogenase